MAQEEALLKQSHRNRVAVAALAAGALSAPTVAEARPISEAQVENAVSNKLHSLRGKTVSVPGGVFIPSRIKSEFPARVFGPHQGHGGGVLCGGRIKRRCYSIQFAVTFKHRRGVHVPAEFFFGN